MARERGGRLLGRVVVSVRGARVMVAGLAGIAAVFGLAPAQVVSSAVAQVPAPSPAFLLTPVAGGVAGVGLNFETSRMGPGASNSNAIPPGTSGAVGPNHIVELINGNMEIFDKATGASLEARTLNSFWTDRVGVPAPADVAGYFEPRIVYDFASQRWFAVSVDNAVPPASNNLVIGRSDTSDPTGDWDGIRVDADTVAPEEFHDLPTLGVDADAVYVCTTDFDFAGGEKESCYSFPKADLLLAAPTAANMSRFEGTPPVLTSVEGSFQPSVDFGPSDGEAPLFGSTGTQLVRTEIIGAGNPVALPGTLTGVVGDPTHADPPDARQPPGRVGEIHPIQNAGPWFPSNAFEQGNSQWLVHSVLGTAGNAALRWYQIHDFTDTMIQTGLIENPAQDFIAPSIAVNAHGDVVIGYTCSGPSLPASACVSLGTTSGGVTTFQPPAVVTQGAGIYFQDFGGNRNRWGPSSATVLDPSDPCTFWTFQEYVAVAGSGDIGPDPDEVASGAWGVRVVELTFAGCLADAGQRDFGDAPDTYATTLASNGARHLPNFSAPVLGSEVDYEANGLPSAALNGDDANGTDDEDGVSFPTSLVPTTTGSATVTASGPGGRLDAFIDFNRNGTFTDPGEQIASALVLAAGPNNVTFAVPASAVPGPTVARFRISTTGGFGPTGEAPNGEVEDHSALIGGREEFCAGPPPPGAIVGTGGNDILIGTPGNDVMFGLGGNDELRGLGGDDVLCGGAGHDWLQGGDGNDVLVGGNDTDRLEGGAADDTLFGAAGIDRLEGGTGNDSLSGGAGNDRLDGNEGTNTNNGGADPDYCVNPQGGVGCELP